MSQTKVIEMFVKFFIYIHRCIVIKCKKVIKTVNFRFCCKHIKDLKSWALLVDIEFLVLP